MRKMLAVVTVAVLVGLAVSEAKAQAWASPYAWGGNRGGSFGSFYLNNYGSVTPYNGGPPRIQQMPSGFSAFSGATHPMFYGYTGRYSPSPSRYHRPSGYGR